MHKHEQKINRNLMIGWIVIVVVLNIAYFGEYLKGQRSGEYIMIFSGVTLLPVVGCLFFYMRNKQDERLRYLTLSGYFIMYIFVLLTGSTTMVFTYIFPLLSLIVLYHQPRMVLGLGIITLAINLLYDAQLLMNGKINMDNSKEIEIQIALIVLCFSFLYVASKMYDDIKNENDEYTREIDQKNTEIQRVTLQTITTIANIIDAKDEYTKGHSQRVAQYSAAIAREMGYDEKAVSNVQCIGMLHDIGKIGIPDSILNKPGRLTDEEFSLMKQHVLIGGNILKDNQMIKDLEKGARYHHERYDGKGYGEGLQGKEIPEIARIIGIADAYDAMTSNRIYRKRLSDEEVINELRRCKGTQFDPQIADVFIKLLEENRIEQLSPDDFVMPDELSEQSTKLLQNIIEIQNQQGKKDQEHDHLTGIYTRESGTKKIKEIMEHTDGGVILVDIGNLRGINREYGFISGDHLIKNVADVILGFREEMIVLRYDGDEVLCFIPGIHESKEMEKIMQELYDKITQQIGMHGEYDMTWICMGGALSAMLQHDYTKCIIAAEKAVYYRKQLSIGGWHLYQVVEYKREENVEITQSELNQLVRELKKDTNDKVEYDTTGDETSTQPYFMKYPEFSQQFEQIRQIAKEHDNNVRVVLLSIVGDTTKNGSVRMKDEAVDCLEDAVKRSMRKEDMIMKFGSNQCVMFLFNLPKENVNSVINRVMNHFYKMYTNKDMTIIYEVADLD